MNSAPPPQPDGRRAAILDEGDGTTGLLIHSHRNLGALTREWLGPHQAYAVSDSCWTEARAHSVQTHDPAQDLGSGRRYALPFLTPSEKRGQVDVVPKIEYHHLPSLQTRKKST